MVGSPVRSHGHAAKDRGLHVAIHPINFSPAAFPEQEHHGLGQHSPARVGHHSPHQHSPKHSHHTITYGHDHHHHHHGHHSSTSPSHHLHGHDSHSHHSRPISASTYSVHSRSPHFRGHTVEGLDGEQKTIRQRWLLDWIKQLKDRLPPFQIKTLELDTDAELTDERVQYILSELPQHEVVRFQVMFSRTVGMVDSIASAMDSDFVDQHISNALTRFRDHQARYISASYEREEQEKAARVESKPWEYAINAFSKRVEAAIIIQRKWRQFRARCQEQGFYPSDENPAHWKHWVDFRRKHGWSAEELVDEYGDEVERTDGGKKRPGQKKKVEARYLQPLRKTVSPRSQEQMNMDSADALRDYDRAHRLAEILASRWTRLQDRAERRAQWRAEAEARRQAGMEVDSDDEADESDTDEDDEDKALPEEQREARRKERYLDFISDPEIRKLVQQGVAAKAAAGAAAGDKDMSSSYFTMSSAGLRDSRTDVNTIQDASSARLNALLQSFHAAHQYKQVLYEAKETGELPPAPPIDIHEEVLNLYPDIRQGVLEAYKLDLERALREGRQPEPPPKDAANSLWTLYREMMATVHRLETGYDTEDVEDTVPRVRQLTQYGQQWLQAMEASSQSRKRLLRTRSQGALGMQNVALYRPAGAPKPAFRSRNRTEGGEEVDDEAADGTGEPGALAGQKSKAGSEAGALAGQKSKAGSEAGAAAAAGGADAATVGDSQAEAGDQDATAEAVEEPSGAGETEVAGELSSGGAKAVKRKLSRKFSFRDLCPSHAKQLQPLTARVAYKLAGSVASNPGRRTRPLVVMDTQTLAGFDWSAASQAIEGTEIGEPLLPVHSPTSPSPTPHVLLHAPSLRSSPSLRRSPSMMLISRMSSVAFAAPPAPASVSRASSGSVPDSPKLVRAASIAIAGLQRRASKITAKLSKMLSQANSASSDGATDPRSLSNFLDPVVEGQRLLSFLGKAPPLLDHTLMTNMSTPIIPHQHSLAARASVLPPAMSMYARPDKMGLGLMDESGPTSFDDTTTLQLHTSDARHAQAMAAFAPFRQQRSQILAAPNPGGVSVILEGSEPSAIHRVPPHATPFGTAFGSSVDDAPGDVHRAASPPTKPVTAGASHKSTATIISAKSHVVFKVDQEPAEPSDIKTRPAASRQPSTGGQAPRSRRQSAVGQAPRSRQPSTTGRAAASRQPSSAGQALAAERSNSPARPAGSKPGTASTAVPTTVMAPFSQAQTQQPKSATNIALDAFASLLPQRRQRPERVSMAVLMNKPSSQAAMLWKRAKNAVQKLLRNYPPEVEDTLREAGLTDLGPAQLLERAMTILRAPKLMQLEDYGQVVEVKTRPLSAGTTRDVNRLAADAVARQGANAVLHNTPLGGVQDGKGANMSGHKLGGLVVGGLERGPRDLKLTSVFAANVDHNDGPAGLRAKSAYMTKPEGLQPLNVKPRASLKDTLSDDDNAEDGVNGMEIVDVRPASPVPVIGWTQVSRTWTMGGLSRNSSSRHSSSGAAVMRASTMDRASGRRLELDAPSSPRAVDGAGLTGQQESGARLGSPTAMSPKPGSAGAAGQATDLHSPSDRSRTPQGTGSALHRQMSAFGSVAFRKLSAARRAAEQQLQAGGSGDGSNRPSSRNSSAQRTTPGAPPVLQVLEYNEVQDTENRPLTLFEQHLAEIRGTGPRSLLSPRAKSEFGGRTGSGHQTPTGLAKRASLSSPGAVSIPRSLETIASVQAPADGPGPSGRPSQPAPPAEPRIKTALDELEVDAGGQAGGFSFLGSVLADVFMEQQRLAKAQELAIASLNPVFDARKHVLGGMGQGPLTPEQVIEAKEKVLLEHYKRLHGGHPSGSKVLYNVRRMAIEKMSPEQRKEMQQKYNQTFKNSQFAWLNTHLKMGVVPERIDGASGSGTAPGPSTSGVQPEGSEPPSSPGDSPSDAIAPRTSRATQLRRQRLSQAAGNGSELAGASSGSSLLSGSLNSVPSHGPADKLTEKRSAVGEQPFSTASSSTYTLGASKSLASDQTHLSPSRSRAAPEEGQQADTEAAPFHSAQLSATQFSPPSLSSMPTYSYESRCSSDGPHQQASDGSIIPTHSHAQPEQQVSQEPTQAEMSQQLEAVASEQPSSWRLAGVPERSGLASAYSQNTPVFGVPTKFSLAAGRSDQPTLLTAQPQDWDWVEELEPDGMPTWMARLLMRTTMANKLGMTPNAAQRQRFQQAVALQQRSMGPSADMHAAITLSKPQNPGPPLDQSNPLVATLPSAMSRPVIVGSADTSVTLGGVVAAPPIPESDLSPSRQRPQTSTVEATTPLASRSAARSPSKQPGQRYAGLTSRPASNASTRQSVGSPKVGLRSRAGDRYSVIHGSAPAGLFTTSSSAMAKCLPNVNTISVPPSRGQLTTPSTTPFLDMPVLVRFKRTAPATPAAVGEADAAGLDNAPLRPKALAALPGTDHDFPVLCDPGVLSG